MSQTALNFERDLVLLYLGVLVCGISVVLPRLVVASALAGRCQTVRAKTLSSTSIEMQVTNETEPSNDGLRAARILTQRQGLHPRLQRAASGGRQVSARQGMGAGRRRRYVNGQPNECWYSWLITTQFLPTDQILYHTSMKGRSAADGDWLEHAKVRGF